MLKALYFDDPGQLTTREVGPLTTYAQIFRPRPSGPPLDRYLTSQAQQQMAIASAMDIAVMTFYQANGRWPGSTEEFLQSGLATVDRNSINPLTGQRFRLDGSPLDLLFELRSQSDGTTQMNVEPVDAGGNPFRVLSMY